MEDKIKCKVQNQVQKMMQLTQMRALKMSNDVNESSFKLSEGI